MTSLELLELELAAKAHGLSVDRVNATGDHIYTGTLGKWWSPLMVDGDALRLAIALRIDLCFFDGFGAVQAITPSGDIFEEPYGDCAATATRRAITRAAAEIGKALA